MILTLRYHMTTPDGEPTKLREAAAMFYSGRLHKIAEQLNKEALDEAGLEYVALQHIELERTPSGNTVLVIVTAAIYRETKKHD